MAESISDTHFATNMAENPLENLLKTDLINPLWQYACQVYSKEGIEPALIELQDRHGADINLILQALWLATEGKEWSQTCVSGDYNQWVAEQVIPLRKMRRNMKITCAQHRELTKNQAQDKEYAGVMEDFRQQVKVLELKAEQYGLAMLFLNNKRQTAEKSLENDPALAKSNVLKCAEYLNISPQALDHFLSLI